MSRAAPAVAALAVFAALVALHPHHFHHIDEIQLALGARDLDLAWHHPHPPGYYGFVVLARAAGALGAGDAGGRFVASAAAAAFVWLVGAFARGGARVAVSAAAAAFVLASPLVLVFAVAGLTHVPEAAAYVALLLWLAARPRGPVPAWLGLAIGAAAGLRQTLLAWGVAMIGVQALRDRRVPGIRETAAFAAALAIGVALWLVPLLVEAGGFDAYRRATAPTALGNVWAKSLFLQPAALGARLPEIARDVALGLGPLGVLAALGLWLRWRRPTDALRRLDPLPIGAALAFGFYVLLIYDSHGYALAPVLALAAHGLLVAAHAVAGASPSRRRAAWAALAVAPALALVGPLGLATAGGGAYGADRAHETRLAARFAAIRAGLAPETTLLVTSHEYWSQSFRHVMYALPEYTTLQLAHDSFYTGTTPDSPYLTATGHRVFASGPDGLRVAELRAAGRPAPQRVVYVFPHDAARFVDASCRALFRPLAEEADSPWVAPVVPDLRVRDGRLSCAPD